MQVRNLSTVNFDDQDWDLEDPFPRPHTDPLGVWKVAAGVAFGILIGAGLMWAINAPGALQDASPSASVTVAAPLPTEPTGAGTPAQEPALFPASEPLVAAVREAGAARVTSAAQHAAERKERAWAVFYKPPAACDDSPPKASMVECANHFIRAKREFEQSYSVGKPAPPRPAASVSRSASGP